MPPNIRRRMKWGDGPPPVAASIHVAASPLTARAVVIVAVPVTPLAAVVEFAARNEPIVPLLVAKSRVKFAGSVNVPHDAFAVVEMAPIRMPPAASVSPEVVVMRGEVPEACPTFASVLVAVAEFAPLSS